MLLYFTLICLEILFPHSHASLISILIVFQPFMKKKKILAALKSLRFFALRETINLYITIG